MATIEFRRVPVVNGKAYASMDAFQVDAIKDMLLEASISDEDATALAEHLTNKKEQVIEILTLNTRSRPQMRKERKARKPRKQDTTLPLEPKDNT